MVTDDQATDLLNQDTPETLALHQSVLNCEETESEQAHLDVMMETQMTGMAVALLAQLNQAFLVQVVVLLKRTHALKHVEMV